jgi:glycosyltransferase involved in cell wall biosynthesis
MKRTALAAAAIPAISSEKASSMSSADEIERFLERVLDAMSITDRPYRHLQRSLPLVRDIVARIQRTAHPEDKVLLIGGNALLGNALLAMGCDLDIWQFPSALASDEMNPRIRREITPEDLEQLDLPDGEYRHIIAPLILEGLRTDAADFLRRLRGLLTTDGMLIIATKNQSRLGVRLAAAFGKPLATRQEGLRLSFSWPALPIFREYHRDELIASARKAGFRVRSCQGVIASRDFFEMDALSPSSYLQVKGTRLLCALAPFARDVLVLELSPRNRVAAQWDADRRPSVSIIVPAVEGSERLRSQLTALRNQTYPPEALELLIIHDGRSADVASTIEKMPFPVREVRASPPEGALARNAAMAKASGQVCAHTDALTQPTPDWVEAGVMALDEDTAVVAGPVFAAGDSCPSCLDLPGVQPEMDFVGRRRQDLFSISNVFYRTESALAVGGFSRRFQPDGGDPALGWDADLAWRLQREGWRAEFREEVCVWRTFPDPNGTPVRDHIRRASELPALYAAIPEAATTVSVVFASRSTKYFDLMLAGATLALVRKRWPWLLLALPWLGLFTSSLDYWPPRQWRYSLRIVAKCGTLHLVWLAGLLKGSVQSRRLLL